jgi:hypothetical protein
MDFVEFPKMARLSREVIVTEKIDGTNAAVVIEDGLLSADPQRIALPTNAIARIGNLNVYAQSRTRFITPESDNAGFARWVVEHAEELAIGLGVGRHFGEWFGSGIQRTYGLKEKRFALFNVSRWDDPAVRPACCHVVPTLWRGNFSDLNADLVLGELALFGSQAVPDFMRPEGIVVFHVAAGIGFKKTIEKDEVPKSVAERQAA